VFWCVKFDIEQKYESQGAYFSLQENKKDGDILYKSYDLPWYIMCDLSKGMDHVPRIYVSMGVINTDKCAQNIGIHGIFGIQHVP